MSNKKPCWEELINNNGVKHKVGLLPADFGVITEFVGIRVVKEILKSRDSINKFFPGINILYRKRVIGDWDYGTEIHYKNDGKFGKNMLIFEIKHGKNISHRQMHKYSNMIVNPKDYFPEINEVKVFYMLFDKMDTANRTTSYCFCELEKSLAKRDILNIPNPYTFSPKTT